MAPHSSTLAWKIPWMEEPDRLQSMGSLRVGHDWANSLSLFTFMHWRRKWQPSPVFLPGESQGLQSLVGCRLWGHTESDMTSDLAAAAAPTGYRCSSGLPTSDLISGSFSWQVLPNWIVGLINSVVKVPFIKTGLWSYVWEVALQELGVGQNCFQCFSL